MDLDKVSTFGKKFIVEPKSAILTAEEKRLLEQLQPAGFMFRARNFLQDENYETWLPAFRNLVRDCKLATGRKKLIWSIDHEGGRVIRPPLPITRFPYATKWIAHVEAVAQAMAIELKSLGINVNFAPVADIHTNPDNPVINERAFGTTAKEVSAAASKFATTMLGYGIFPCAKHFPGYGDVKLDPHYHLAEANWGLSDLRRRELLPFQALIDLGIPLIMTAHILLPKIDPDNQATTSKKILHDLLRHEMGFNKVIIADALGMKGILKEFKSADTTSKALNAGLDLFLVAGDNTDLEMSIEIAKQMQASVKDGSVSQGTLAASFQRIDNLLDKLPQHLIEQLDKAVFTKHAQLAKKLSARQAPSNFKLHVPGFE